jgi:hypothetical protein
VRVRRKVVKPRKKRRKNRRRKLREKHRLVLKN